MSGVIRRRQEYSSDFLQQFGGEFVTKDPRPVRMEPPSQAKRVVKPQLPTKYKSINRRLGDTISMLQYARRPSRLRRALAFD
jgi:hypothetical protein